MVAITTASLAGKTFNSHEKVDHEVTHRHRDHEQGSLHHLDGYCTEAVILTSNVAEHKMTYTPFKLGMTSAMRPSDMVIHATMRLENVSIAWYPER